MGISYRVKTYQHAINYTCDRCNHTFDDMDGCVKLNHKFGYTAPGAWNGTELNISLCEACLVDIATTQLSIDRPAPRAQAISHDTTDQTQIHIGFSERINQLIDRSNLIAPSLHNGRGAWLAEIAEVSKAATTGWLTGDKLPKSTTLRRLVIFITKHLAVNNISIPSIEAWLRYGSDTIVPPGLNLD